jgi:hypothetical protein
MGLPLSPRRANAAAGNITHKLLYGGLADLRPMPSTLIDDGPLRSVYFYRPGPDDRADGNPVLLVPPLAAPAIAFDLRRGCSVVEHLVSTGRRSYLVDYGRAASGPARTPRPAPGRLDSRRATPDPSRRGPRLVRLVAGVRIGVPRSYSLALVVGSKAVGRREVSAPSRRTPKFREIP